MVFRPSTEDDDPLVRIKDGEASDICLRGIPIIPRGALALSRKTGSIINVTRRIAGPQCRLTFSGAVEDMQALKAAFPFQPLEEFADGEIVIPSP
jgi:hypothetical protein